MAKLKVNDIFDMLKAVKRDISDVDTSQRLRIANMLNQEIYEWNKSICPSDNFGIYDFSTTNGVNRYSLPTDFEDTKGLGFGLYTRENGEAKTQIQETIANSGVEGYYIGGEIVSLVYTPSLYIIPTPSSTQDYRLIYSKTLTDLISLDDSLILDTRYRQLARDFVLKEYAIFDDDPSREQVADQRYSISKAEYIKDKSTTPKVFSI